MRPPFPFETAAPAPPAALLRRFDRCATRNLALPPLADWSPAFGAHELREVLARHGQANGPARRLPLHLAVSVPCGDGLDAKRSVSAIAVEARAFAQAIGSPQQVARARFRACGDAAIAGRQLGDLLDGLAAPLRLDAADVGVQARWPGLAALREWHAAGATTLVLDAVRAGDLAAARDIGFESVEVRVACGRHGQDGDALADELRAMLRSGATRVQLQAYASLLEASCSPCVVPSGPIALFEERGVLRARAIATLQEDGLRHVGRGLFARADDRLVAARERDRLHLEVDGLAAGPAAGTLALGAGGVGRIGAAYYRNAGVAAGHARTIEQWGLSVAGGVALANVGQARRSAVASLVCHGRLDFEAISLAYLVETRRCFARELRELAALARAGLVEMDDTGVDLTPQGEHLVDSVAAIFDRGP